MCNNLHTKIHTQFLLLLLKCKRTGQTTNISIFNLSGQPIFAEIGRQGLDIEIIVPNLAARVATVASTSRLSSSRVVLWGGGDSWYQILTQGPDTLFGVA